MLYLSLLMALAGCYLAYKHITLNKEFLEPGFDGELTEHERNILAKPLWLYLVSAAFFSFTTMIIATVPEVTEKNSSEVTQTETQEMLPSDATVADFINAPAEQQDHIVKVFSWILMGKPEITSESARQIEQLSIERGQNIKECVITAGEGAGSKQRLNDIVSACYFMMYQQ